VEPITEFRTLQVEAEEPTDRTTAGTVLGGETTLDLGEVDTTDEPQDIPVRVIWWRVADMSGASEITNIRVWLAGIGALSGTNLWYMDITDTWTKGKIPIQVATGSPGDAPLAEPTSNLTRIGGGTITGITHDQTSQYIYLTGRIGLDEPTGGKTGLTLTVTYDYH
jgi:hypothetical protein